jgi:alkylated DNA repair dioxygenase AlkB
MASSPELVWQPSLLAIEETVDIDRGFSRLDRVRLDGGAWVDHQPDWITGADRLFEEVLAGQAWQQRSRRMYDKRVDEPRLTAPWSARSGDPLRPPLLEEVRRALAERYERDFDSVGFNLYRDGRDSVAWHADRIAKEIAHPIVALVSLGEPRRFLLRPKGGGASRTFLLGRGDLLVTGGQTQRTWEHSVPKVKQAGPRISMAFRHDMDPSVYARKRVEPPADQGAAETGPVPSGPES